MSHGRQRLRIDWSCGKDLEQRVSGRCGGDWTVVGTRFLPRCVTDNMDDASPEEIDEMFPGLGVERARRSIAYVRQHVRHPLRLIPFLCPHEAVRASRVGWAASQWRSNSGCRAARLSVPANLRPEHQVSAEPAWRLPTIRASLAELIAVIETVRSRASATVMFPPPPLRRRPHTPSSEG